MAKATRRSPVLELALAAKEAARRIAGASTGAKNAALLAYARLLETETGPLLAANAQDLAAAKRRGLSAALQDGLDEKRPRSPRDCARSPRCPTPSARSPG
jgi:glutamate-5-semialdehyde dehydrogenase